MRGVFLEQAICPGEHTNQEYKNPNKNSIIFDLITAYHY